PLIDFVAPWRQETLMEDVVKVDVELTSADYETFFAAAAQRAFVGKAVRVRYGLMVIVGLALWVSLSSIVSAFLPGVPFIRLAIFFFVVSVFSHVWVRFSRRVMAPERGGPLLGPHTFLVTPEGFEDHGKFSLSLTKWPAIRALQETPNHIFVFI